jgi:tetratricopeptide (TPR) repeat protein
MAEPAKAGSAFFASLPGSESSMVQAPFLAAVIGAGSAAATEALTLDCVANRTPEVREVALAQATPLRLRLSAPGSVLEIEERGRELTVSATGARIAEITTPPRYGRFVVVNAGTVPIEVSLSALHDYGQQDRVALHLSCDNSPSSHSAWLERVAALDAQLAPLSTGAAEATEFDNELAKLRPSAPDAPSQALLAHIEAQSLLMRGASRRAADAFARAAGSWRELGDGERELAARVGQVEDLQRAGASREVLNVIGAAARAHQPGYFRIRLDAARCLALRALGRLEDAESCYRVAIAGFKAIDEIADAVSYTQDLTVLLLDADRYREAEETARAILPLVRGEFAEQIRGRIRLTLYDTALRRGAIDAALSEIAAALGHFQRAGAPRWEANARLKLAGLYTQLGAFAEAYDAVRLALAQLPPRDAPARIASALVVLARIELANQRELAGLDWARRAESLFERLAMPAERDAARVQMLDAWLRLGREADARRHLATWGEPAAAQRPRWQLLQARLSHPQRHRLALARLDALERTPQPLALRVDLQRTRARLQHARGRHDTALALLRNEVRALQHAAASITNPLLRQVLARQSVPLQRTAIDLLLAASDEPAERVDTDALLELTTWIAPIEGARPRPGPDTQPFDESAAALLFPGSTPSAVDAALASGQRALLELLRESGTPQATGPPRDAKPEAALPEASIAQRLGSGHLLLVPLIGEHVQAVLRIDGAGVAPELERLDAPLAAGAARLAELLANPNAEPHEIASRTEPLARALFGAARPPDPPRRVTLLAQDGLAGLPLGLLPWRDGQPLLAHATVEIASTLRTGNGSRLAPPARVHALAADAGRWPAPNLPPLPHAAAEAELIATLLAPHRIEVVPSPDATRARLLDALAQSDAWVHLAAHGFARPERLGHAGVWLASAASVDVPEFVSWLDVRQRGARAPLVVLNACELGSGAAMRSSDSFAAALNAAGSAHVIAAQWAVSEAASSQLLRTFYPALIETGDPALALRRAQLALRDSRHFRHPWYWAGFTAFARAPSPP